MHGEPAVSSVTAALYQHVAAHAGVWRSRDLSEPLPRLNEDTIQLVTLDLSRVTGEMMNAVLNDADRARGERIRDRGKRNLYLGGRFGLKRLLHHYSGIGPDDQMFVYGRRGKPSLGGESIRFNYTMSRDKVLYGFTQNRELGVDMEVLPRQINAGHMAATRLTSAERTAWQQLPVEQRNDGMLCCWTRKEAYGKTIGVGIRFRLGEVQLFNQLSAPRWQTKLGGLFDDTDESGMPTSMEGVQLALPFDGVASLMYAHDHQARSPGLETFQLALQ